MWHKVILDNGGIAYFDDKAYQRFEEGMEKALNSLLKEGFRLEEMRLATPSFGPLHPKEEDWASPMHSEKITIEELKNIAKKIWKG